MIRESRKRLPDRLLAKDRYVWLSLAAAGVLLRIPFLKAVTLVTYDGTYYINHAQYLLGKGTAPSGFPVGYPLMIALANLAVKDGVRAAQAVSLAAGLSIPPLVYLITGRFAGKKESFAAALVVLFSPLALRISLITMSESLYIFWLFLGMLLFAKERHFLSGISGGLAAMTRPEGAAVFAVLAVLKRKAGRQLALLLAGFIAVYSVNVVLQSMAAGRLVIVPKTGLLGTHAENWRMREKWIEFEGAERYRERVEDMKEDRGIISDYALALPGELTLLVRHVSPFILFLSIYAAWKRRSFVLAALIPFLFYPLFTFRSEPRFILPYIPVFAVYSGIGISLITGKEARRLVYVFLAAAVLSVAVLNLDQATVPESQGFMWARDAGRRLAPRVRPWDAIADRKPYFPFYAGGQYVEIPVATYDATMQELYSNKVKYLVCHFYTIYALRPNLRPFLFDRELIRGETRYRQIAFIPDVLALYEIETDHRPLERSVVLSLTGERLMCASWSPDGKTIAYRKMRGIGAAAVCLLPADGGRERIVFECEPSDDPISWSPDSRSLAFSRSRDGNFDIFIMDGKGKIARVTESGAADTSPSWAPDGKTIYFCSDRGAGSVSGGRRDIWSKDISTGALVRITSKGDNSCPSVSPDGERLAWIRDGRDLMILGLVEGRENRAGLEKDLHFPPAWSPDGRHIAVTGRKYERTAIDILTSDGMKALQVTGSDRDEGYPSWHRDGGKLVCLSISEDRSDLVVISNLEILVERLSGEMKGKAFTLPADKRSISKAEKEPDR